PTIFDHMAKNGCGRGRSSTGTESVMADSPRALVVVDAQPTFCEGGALPSPGANAVCEAIARYVAAHRSDYALVVTTQDWHIDPGRHFATPPDEPDFVDTWPPHG